MLSQDLVDYEIVMVAKNMDAAQTWTSNGFLHNVLQIFTEVILTPLQSASHLLLMLSTSSYSIVMIDEDDGTSLHKFISTHTTINTILMLTSS